MSKIRYFYLLILHIAGQDATEAFFGLHLYEVLQRPQYSRLQIGVIHGEESQLHGKLAGEISKVPFAEPSWLVEGYQSPYYKEVSFARGECHWNTERYL